MQINLPPTHINANTHRQSPGLISGSGYSPGSMGQNGAPTPFMPPVNDPATKMIMIQIATSHRVNRHTQQTNREHQAELDRLNEDIDKKIKNEGGQNSPMDIRTPAPQLESEKNILVKLYYTEDQHARAQSEYAASLYGGNSLTDTVWQVHQHIIKPAMASHGAREQRLNNWAAAHTAARKSQIHAETARRLREKESQLNVIIAEQARRAAEAAAIAYAQAVAKEQAHRLAAEAAERERVAAEAEAARTAEAAERSRVEAEAQIAAHAAAEAQRQTEEQAAQAAAEAQRQAEELQRLAAEEKNRPEAEVASADLTNTYRLQGAVAAARPLFMTTAGTIAVAETAALTLQAAIRAAISGLTAAAASVATGLFVGVSALIYSPKLGNGELPPSYAFSTPLSDILPDGTQNLHAIAVAEGSIELPYRLGSKATDQGDSELIVVSTGASSLPPSVKVVAATHNPQNNTYSVQTTDNPSKTLIWTPTETSGNSSTTLPSEEQVPTVIVGSSVMPVEGRIDSFPQVAEVTFNDRIVIFPIDSGLPPIYVMFKDRREEPGTVTGNGEPVGERWLSGVSAGEGATIPSQIAGRIRGKKFNSFKEFREEFWKAIGSDPDLARQFTPQNIAHLSKGRGPVARRADWIGGRTKLEIHHHIPLSSGGKLYDLDNLRITTPKLHISIHNAGKDHVQ